MAGEKVKELCRRAAAALDAAGVPYCVIGGNAVGEWVGRIDEGAVRYTKDVDILLRRSDLTVAGDAMRSAGFIPDEVMGIPIFLDGPNSKPSQGVHVILANEKVKPTDPVPAPDVLQSERTVDYLVLNLESLVQMKLVSYRLKDQVHLQDMHRVGLIDQTWPAKYPSPLRERLQTILDNPDG